MGSTTILSLSVDGSHAFILSVNPWLIAAVLLILLGIILIRWAFGRFWLKDFQIDTAEVGFGSGTLSFKPNVDDQQIAYKIWVELSTRKIGLPIDLGHDVISEIYDSWHSFFSITRELIKDIPVNKVKHKSTRKIIKLSIDVLNEGLRPHLTTWQARFRHWYDKQLQSATDDIEPQSLQSKYPRFDELKGDLVQVNERLIKYREKMREIVLGRSEDISAGEKNSLPKL